MTLQLAEYGNLDSQHKSRAYLIQHLVCLKSTIFVVHNREDLHYEEVKALAKASTQTVFKQVRDGFVTIFD